MNCAKKYCWFNLKNEVTWLPLIFKLIEMEKLSWYNEGDWFNHKKLKILCYLNYINYLSWF